MRIGVIASSGGGVFGALQQILAEERPDSIEWMVVTDRHCGIEDICHERRLSCRRIEEPDNALFSEAASTFFDDTGGMDFVMLFYLRLVTEQLFTNHATFNIHPSLLPAFQGFNPIRKAIQQRVRFLGATLHLVNESVDGGSIVAQACMPIGQSDDESRLNKLSYIQKVGLGLLLYELHESESIHLSNRNSDIEVESVAATDRMNPALRDRGLLSALTRLQVAEGAEVFR